MSEQTPEPAGAPPPGDERGDEADDDFARLPPPRAGRSRLAALAVIALGGLLFWRLLDDSRYALASRAPADLGDAKSLPAGDARLVDNRFVAIAGLPDLRNALLFEPKGDRYRRAFYRMLGTDSRIVVRADETSTPRALSNRYEGRLRSFDRMPWAEQIRTYYQTKVRATRLIDLESLAARLDEVRHTDRPTSVLRDRAGTALSDADVRSEVYVEIEFPEDVRVSLPKKQFAVEDDARHELTRLGWPVAPTSETTDWFLYVVRVPLADRAALIAKLEEKEWPFQGRRERYTFAGLGLLYSAAQGAESPRSFLAMPGDLPNPPEYAAEGDHLVRKKPEGKAARIVVPWARVASVQLAAPVKIPPDAWILVENERPEDFAWVLALDLGLAIFVTFNAWLLYRSFAARRALPA